MGAFNGSITYSKFFVRGKLPADHRERFVEAIRLRAFTELDPGEDLEWRAGWCSVEDPFDLDLTFQKLFFNDYLNLGLRVDSWKIPSALFKAAMREATRHYLDKNGGEKLTRSQKKNLEVVVMNTLKRKVVPAMRVTDLSWNLAEGTIRFFQQSPKQHELMLDVFDNTFDGLDLVHDGAYVTAQERGMPKALLETMTQLEPTLFHPQRPAGVHPQRSTGA